MLFAQIRQCLRNKQWDTRIAASACLGRMAAHFQHHTVSTLAKQAETKGPLLDTKLEKGLTSTGSMTFDNLSIDQVLKQGTILVASAGQVSSPTQLQKLMPDKLTSPSFHRAASRGTTDLAQMPAFSHLYAVYLHVRNMKRLQKKAREQNRLQGSRKGSSKGEQSSCHFELQVQLLVAQTLLAKVASSPSINNVSLPVTVQAICCRLGLAGKMEELMDTSDLVSDADFLSIPQGPTQANGKGASDLLSDMSGLHTFEPLLCD